ncbi:hypothetical protein K6U17_13080 [Vibrio fluvialis]|uniref:hypothetical protein n=1 Tax=Vibrio fluvialis TaxID=676 RepID=UPI001EEA4E64|nr:hypothetical protein [Vibrio fluvialis]MCG6410156.1 hypothetical protein [Vibrio fluvialis]HDM8037871.1 hypothetical protein [Vibrio fluvialis]
MEEFKKLDELTELDEKHHLLGGVTGYVPDLKRTHEVLSEVTLNDEVPEDIRGQFNVAKNMGLYCYFFYALAPEVQLKTYTIIESALRLKAERLGIYGNKNRPLMLRQLLTLAVDKQWVTDSGFRHIDNPNSANEWCRSMIDVISSLRNSQAHGSSLLSPDFYHHICVCADFLNQLFSK